MKKKTTVVFMVLLLCLSMMLAGCRNRDEAGTDGLNDGLYNDNTLGEDIENGVDDVLEGNDTNNHDGITNNNNGEAAATN